MRELISKAIDGMNKSERFDSSAKIFDNFKVGKQRLHVDFDQINSTINW